ncbi:DOP1 (YDR141C) [Zygosaccharomyces parabailii]|nr:DOP1 (YDR141C) [Zygosaccharomyces parabailii]
MSLPLKPLTIDSNNKQVDSKEKKFKNHVLRALENFDSVTEWADYIASLGRLLKALQSWSPQFQNVKYYVPSPYQVSRRLASSLSPNLPAGVHQKTLEVYTFIFEKIGQDALAAECNIWVPGILPLMSYASMSVKTHLIEVYDNYLIQLPSSTLKLLAYPMLASLFPGIDDESSEFQPVTMKLIDTFRENLDNDSLFWQCCFLIMITSRERRLGGLVWLVKKFPSLNAVPHLVMERNKRTESIGAVDELNAKKLKEDAFSILQPMAKDLLSPEPGLLIRCLVSSLDSNNDILIKRGIWDLLLQRLHLESPVLNVLVSPSDKKLLIMACCRNILDKDMSLNRRIWNWLLGPTASSATLGNGADQGMEDNNEYFVKYGFQSLIEGLKDMIEGQQSITTAINVCISLMDRWQIGSLVVPEMFIPLLLAAKKFSQNQQVLKSSSIFFDTVETNTIWGKIFDHLMETGDLDFLEFVVTSYDVTNEEEIVVRHLPLILLAILSFHGKNMESFKINRYSLCNQLLEIIPERAFLPLRFSQMSFTSKVDTSEILKNISKYYNFISDPTSSQDGEELVDFPPPFSTEDLTFYLIRRAHDTLLENLKSGECIAESTRIFVEICQKIPESASDQKSTSSDWSDDSLVEALFTNLNNSNKEMESVYGIADLYSNYLASRMCFLQSVRLLKLIISSLWDYLVEPHTQLRAVKSLRLLQKCPYTEYMEGALGNAFIKEKEISRCLVVLELLWNQLEPNSDVLRRPVELMIDELFDEQNPHYLSVSKWILSVINSGSSNRLFYLLTDDLLRFPFLKRDQLQDMDDLDMFTYRLQCLTSVLKTNTGVVLENFNSELTSIDSLADWENEDISTYKNLVIVVVMRFLHLKNNNNATSIRSALLLLEYLLNGSEQNFKWIVMFLLQMSSEYISKSGLESDLIAVSLLNIVSKVLRLSHENGIKLDVFDDNTTHLKYVDYLITSVSSMESPLIVTSYVKLLSESLAYFESSIFRMMLPLTASIVQCVHKLLEKEKKHGGYYQSIALLLGGLEELLGVSHKFLIADENEGYFSGVGSRGDFLQNMVSNVFSSDFSANDIKIQGERDIILQSFKEVVTCTFHIWSWAHEISANAVKSPNMNQTNHNSYKFKFTAKKLLEKLFLLEPLEVMEDLVIAPENDNKLTLIHVLDGNRPALTIPYFFIGIVFRQNKNANVRFSVNGNGGKTAGNHLESSLMNKLDSQALISFLLKYASSLENAAVEEFYGDFAAFFKEVSTNYNLYGSISTSVLKFVGIIAEKLQKSRFGEQKRVRREVSDIFVKYLPNALADSPFEYKNPKQSFENLEYVVRSLQYILNDGINGEKYCNSLAIIVSQCVAPCIKSKTESAISEYVLNLGLQISKVGEKVKSWRLLVNDFFMDEKKFILAGDSLWKDIIYYWSHYPENKSKIINDLITAVDSKAAGMISFNSWSESESHAKAQNLLRISFLLMISPVDSYLLQFQSLVSLVCEYIVSKNNKLKSKCWILLRALFLRYSDSHFNEHWSMLTYCLQTNLQEFFEALHIQEEIDLDLLLQTCKTLDLLLALNFEGFSGTNEWLFVIDTINCIYKEYPFMSLVDEIYEYKEFGRSSVEDVEQLDKVHIRVPLLVGITSIKAYTQLKNFFQNLSYAHYESIYSLEEVDRCRCEEDLFSDIFA